jgi:hypothetical protein
MRIDSSVIAGVALAAAVVCAASMAGAPMVPGMEQSRETRPAAEPPEALDMISMESEHRFPLAPGERLHLTTGWSRVRVTAAPTDEVVVRMTRHIGPKPYGAHPLRDPRVAAFCLPLGRPYLHGFSLQDERRDDQLTLTANVPPLPRIFRGWVDLEVRVPEQRPVALTMRGGDVTLARMHLESARVACQFGQVRLEEVAGPVEVVGNAVAVDTAGATGPVTVMRMGRPAAPALKSPFSAAHLRVVEMFYPWNRKFPSTL